MPIAINMDPPQGHGYPDLHAPSPASPRIKKGAFFRAMSPPILDRSSATGTARAHSPNDLAARFQRLETGPNGNAGPSQYSPMSLSEESGSLNSRGGLQVNGHRYGNNEGYASSVGTTGHTPEIAYAAGISYTQPEPERKSSNDVGGGSDEMVMSLLAGQAVVDCESMSVGRWEEVESWKKVCLSLGQELIDRN